MMMDRDRVRDSERVPHVSPVTEAPDEPRWLSEDQQVAWRSFLIAHQLLMSQLDKELRQTHGVGLPEYEVLVHLSEQAGRCMRMALLADDMGMSRSRLTHIVSRMEKRGLVERTAIAEDGRGINCSLTDDGWTLLERSAPLHVEGVRQHLIDLLDDSEIDTMRSIFLKVNSHMRDVP